MKFSSKFIQAVRSSVVSVTLTLTVADVELAIATITSKTKNLCQAIFNFPESDGFLTNSLVCSQLSCSSLPLNHINVEAIHVDAVNLSSSIEKETPDVNVGHTLSISPYVLNYIAGNHPYTSHRSRWKSNFVGYENLAAYYHRRSRSDCIEESSFSISFNWWCHFPYQTRP